MSNCSCCSVNEKSKNLWIYLTRLVTALVAAVVFVIVDAPTSVKLPIFIAAFLCAGWEVFWNACKDLVKGRLFDEHFLMSIASIAAFIIGEYFEAVTLMVFFGIGDLLQELAVKKSRSNITKLMDIRPDYANLKKGNKVLKVHPSEVSAGDIIIVKPGERVALDGNVIRGESFIDTKAITGESVPCRVKPGDEILSGTINNETVIEIRVSKVFNESTVSKILELVQNASDKKTRSEKFITKFAKVYTPIVIAGALAVAFLPPLLGFGTLSAWVYRAISFLVISCPCALVVSIPVGVFGGIGGAARNGILIKGGNFLEDLRALKTVVFDKTGTLTQGVFEVVEINAQNGFSKEQVLEYAAISEQHSSHPIAKSILSYYGKPVTVSAEVTEKSGLGVIAKINEKEILVGSQKLLGLEMPEFPFTTVYISVDKKYAGYILIADKLKNGISESIQAIKSQGVNKTVMLTGDNRQIASAISSELGLTDFKAELLPQHKVEEFERLKQGSSGKVAFVGDGINDAPVLKISDIGIAMGGVGSDAAIEAADVIIMKDDIGKIATAKRIAKKVRQVIKQNITMALGIKAIIMALAFFGIGSILLAIFADVGVALLAVLNAARCLTISHRHS